MRRPSLLSSVGCVTRLSLQVGIAWAHTDSTRVQMASDPYNWDGAGAAARPHGICTQWADVCARRWACQCDQRARRLARDRSRLSALAAAAKSSGVAGFWPYVRTAPLLHSPLLPSASLSTAPFLSWLYCTIFPCVHAPVSEPGVWHVPCRAGKPATLQRVSTRLS